MTERTLDDAIERLAASEQLLIALDFDGTLAPLVDRPDDARATPEARAAMLRLLEAPRTSVALISGRALDSLIHVADPPAEILLSGSHGVEARVGGIARVRLSDSETARLQTLRELAERIAGRIDGVLVENKPAGVALHTRLATPDDAATAQADARAGAASIPGITVRSGSNVLEFAVRSETKGDAVRMLRREAGATAVLFAGDDVTDEDGFAALLPGDVGLKCGEGQTLAEFRVADTQAVARVLERIATIRTN